MIPMKEHRLYHEQLLALARQVRAQTPLAHPTHWAEKVNRSCGDRIAVSLEVENARIKGIFIEVEGCAICEGAAGILLTNAAGQPLETLDQMQTNIEAWLTKNIPPPYPNLTALEPIKTTYKTRQNCAKLPFQTATLAARSAVIREK